MSKQIDDPGDKPAVERVARNRARDARYNASEKGRARHRRYNQSEQGLARYKRYYDLNSFELNYDRDARRRRQRIAELSALLYGADAQEGRAKLGRGSANGTPTERRKRMEELARLVASRRSGEERRPSTTPAAKPQLGFSWS
jgi:hypothetical protein